MNESEMRVLVELWCYPDPISFAWKRPYLVSMVSSLREKGFIDRDHLHLTDAGVREVSPIIPFDST